MNPTLSSVELERILQMARAASLERSKPQPSRIARAERNGRLPLSFAQQRLWFIDQLEPGSTAYHMPSALRLRGPLDPRVLERALGEVVRRHEALRTTFGETEGVPFQVVHPAGAARLELTDLSRLAAKRREAEARRRVREAAQRPFDLRRGPLLRTHLLRLGEEEHVLVLAMHHVVSDGWSMGVLFGELSALYEAFSRGEASPLPELPVQYADYAVWQRAWLSAEAMEEQIAWWRERLEGAPPVLELLTDRRRQGARGTRGGRVFRALPSETAEGVRALARREGATPFMVLLAVLDLLLARWSGQEDVVVGTPIANRTRRETEGLIGFFVNTLALRADVSGNPRVSELLGRVRETTLGAYQHQDVPFERLVEELQVQRSLSHTPLFQVMFSLGDGTGDPRPFGGLAVEPYPTGGSAAKFDLTVAVVERQGGLGVSFTYREELWDASTLERVAGAYALLLEAVAVEAGRRVLDIPLMTDAERERVLRQWSAGPAVVTPPVRPLHELVAEQAARAPGLPAVTSGAASLTYAELERASGRLANHLRRRGVGPETRVGICLERGVELLVAVLGVLRAGGAYVPLDPDYPAERLAFTLADSGAALLVSQASVVERLSGYAGETVRLDADGERIAAEAEGTPAAGTDPRSAAYVLYTSGSTGTPKGVVVEHGSLAHFVATMRRVFEPREGETVLAMASFAFDIWVFEALVPLASGATVRVLPLERVREPAAVVEELRTAGMMNAVPSLMRSIVAAARDAGPDALAGVRWVFSGGEAVTPDLLAEMRDAFPGARRCVLYGPTEATVLATRYEVPADGGAGAAMLGRPLPDVRVYVLDGEGTPQPVGVPGELYVGGAGVARGYLGRPERTAERWVPDPFSGEAGTRLYRTGDRARWRADGQLEYLGRSDDQVKVRGFRVELGEVEAVVGRHPAVRGVAAVVRGGSSGSGDVGIVAYLEADAGISVAQVREHARASLPEFMVPATFVVLDALPLTPTGKVDRRALPEPEPAAAPADEEPRTELERAIAGVWAEVLGVPAVGVGTSFFDLGGNSLLVVRAARLLESALGRKVRVLDFFEHVTVADLARHFSGAAASASMGDAGENRGENPRAGNDGPARLRQAIPVRPTGSERPLFLVHDGLGSVAYVQVLHQHFDEELPVYALPAASGDELPLLRTVEGMATRLVRMVREVQPVGPYRLAGWSFGGILAYEMAAQLIGQDQAVEFLGMIDTYHPSLAGSGAGDTGDGEQLPFRILRREDTGESDGTGREKGLLPGHLTVDEAQEVQDRLRIHHLGLRGYSPRPLPLPVHLFFARDDAGADPWRGWQTLLDDVSISATPVPGTHLSMMEAPNVESLGRALSREIGRATANRQVLPEGH